MTTPIHEPSTPARQRPSHSPRLPPIQDYHPRTALPDAWNDAFARLQQQVQYNTNALDDQRKHLAELHEAARAMHAEIGTLWQHIDTCNQQLRSRSQARGERSDAGDIDVLAHQLQAVASKANDVEGLKIQLDLLTRRVRRVEGQPTPPAQSGPGPEPTAYPHHPAHQPHHPPHQSHGPSPVDARAYSQQPHDERQTPAPVQQLPEPRHSSEHPSVGEPRSLPGFRALETGADVASWRAASSYAPAPPHDSAHHPHRDQPQSINGWSAVNVTPGKRPAMLDNHGTSSEGPGSTSPKRQKLATLMPRTSSDESPSNAHHGQRPDTAMSHLQRSSSEQPGAGPNPHNIRFAPFPPAEPGAAHQSWRALQDPARIGRARAMSRHSSNYDEYDDAEATAQQQHAWAMHHADPQAAAHYHRAEPYRQQHPAGMEHGYDAAHDPAGYDAAGKKSRTKPTRNAHGVLIRKDGRPDMRSISSAQNLRKVHAKKEAERVTAGSVAGSSSPPPAASAVEGGADEEAEERASPEVEAREDTPSRRDEAKDAGGSPRYELVKGDAPVLDAIRDTQERAVEGVRVEQGVAVTAA